MQEETNTGARWYALQVHPKHETMVSTLLQYKGYEQYLPTYRAATPGRKKATERVLFPGYVFCKITMHPASPVQGSGKVVTTEGVIRIVGAGRKPIAIEGGEIEGMQRALETDSQAEPWPFLAVGDIVEVEAGPLKGIRGSLVSTKGRDLLVLSVQLLQRSLAVTIDRRMVRAVNPRPVPVAAACAAGA